MVTGTGWKVVVAAVVVLIVVSVVVFASSLVEVGVRLPSFGGYRGDDLQVGRFVRADQPDEWDVLVASVGDMSVSLADLREEMVHVANVRSVMVRENPLFLVQAGLPSDHYDDWISVFGRWDVETGALAIIVEELALFERAQELGLVVMDLEVELNQEKAMLNYGLADPDYRAYVESVGEETYWAEVYPRVARLSLTIDNLQAHVEQEAVESLDFHSKTVWLNYRAAVMEETEVSVFESVHHSVTLDDVLGYLAELREVHRNLG